MSITQLSYGNDKSTKELQDFDDYLKTKMGVTFKLEKNNLDIYVRQDDLLNYVVPVVETTAIWPGVNPQTLKIAPKIITSMISIYTSVMILNHVYDDTNSDNLSVHTYLVNSHGQPSENELLYAYEITRVAFNNIDKDSTNALSFINQVNKFQYSDWYNKNVLPESALLYKAIKS
jgi:hypothetical protein